MINLSHQEDRHDPFNTYLIIGDGGIQNRRIVPEHEEIDPDDTEREYSSVVNFFARHPKILITIAVLAILATSVYASRNSRAEEAGWVEPDGKPALNTDDTDNYSQWDAYTGKVEPPYMSGMGKVEVPKIGFYPVYGNQKNSFTQGYHRGFIEALPPEGSSLLTTEDRTALLNSQAIDVSGGNGTELYSPISGTVLAKYIDKWGNPIIIIGNNDYLFSVFHAALREDINEGDEIGAGDLFGTEGNMGYTKTFGNIFCGTGSNCGFHGHFVFVPRNPNEPYDPNIVYELFPNN